MCEFFFRKIAHDEKNVLLNERLQNSDGCQNLMILAPA